jgi:hypothetical protein
VAKTVVHDTPSVTVWYHSDSNIVHSHVRKFVTGKEFQDFLMAGYGVLVKNRAKKWLSDDRSNSVLRQDDVEWGNQNWLPKCVAAGWKYWAIVQPEKVLASAPMERLVEDFKKLGITSRFFSDPIAAMAWLETQP